MSGAYAPSLLIAALLVTAAGCATSPDQARPRPLLMGEVRGREVAEVQCAACHSIDLFSDSPRMNAPPFRVLDLRFNAITWERKMAEIAIGGHDEMPAIRLPDSDVRDLETYIRGLR